MSTEASSSDAQAAITALPRVRRPGRVPIKSWALDVEGSALEQATNLSNLPFAIGHVALMPDAHAGYGIPIGLASGRPGVQSDAHTQEHLGEGAGEEHLNGRSGRATRWSPTVFKVMMDPMTPPLVTFDTALGRCAIRWSDAGIASVLLPSRRGPPGIALEDGAASSTFAASISIQARSPSATRF
jgi:hypothetical protein